MAVDNWTKEQSILAINLYFKLPFGSYNDSNKEVKQLAGIIGRTPGAVAMKLSNFASLDPFHINRGIKGLKNSSKQDKQLWVEFLNSQEEMLFEGEKILADREHTTIEAKYHDILASLPKASGEDRFRQIKTRVNQSVFRQFVLANYKNTCVISKIEVKDLLLASHIIPWSVNVQERLNPENGLCLSAIHDRAFDKGLIGVDTDYKVVISKELRQQSDAPFFHFYFGQFEGKPIEKARKYFPRKEFLEYHLNNVFRQ